MKDKKWNLIIFTCLFILINSINIYKNVNKPVFLNNKFVIRTIIFAVIYILVLIIIKRGLNFIYQYRYITALSILILIVILNLNGSSIAMWSQYINSGESIDKGVILGTPRAIRSDEWALFTPMALSQYYSDFKYFGNIVRASMTDMFLVYGQPVKDMAVIFKPFQIGYLFLDPGRGLSFFWYGRLIALFIVSFEFGMLITKKKKELSLIYALLIALAPIIQWWFSINGLVEMFVFGQLEIIILNKYLEENSYAKKILYMCIIIVCAGGYILTFYPSWQIPLFYVFMGMLIWTICEHYKKFKFTYKDYIIILAGILVLVMSMLHVVVQSKNTINTIMNTAYPGQRLETGGGEIKRYVNYIVNVFFAFTSDNLPTNVCELAGFIDFFPLGIILSIITLMKDRKKDSLLIILLIIDIFLSLWCILPVGKKIAQITLLSNSQPGRTFVAIGFVNIMLLLRAVAIREKEYNFKIVLLLACIVNIIMISIAKLSYKDYFNKKMMIISFILFASVYIFFLAYENYKMKNIGFVVCVLLMFMSGAIVNPIQHGVNNIYDSELIQIIESVNKKDSGKWIVEGMNYPKINYPIMVGAETINSTNIYPNLERWSTFDVNNKNRDIYNRYAHINVYLKNNEITKFIPGEAPDTFTLDLNVGDLRKLDVKYIFTINNLDEYSNDKIKIEKVYEKNEYKIYKVK